MSRRTQLMTGIGLALVALVGALVWSALRGRNQPVGSPNPGTVGALAVDVVSLNSAPADVQDAAVRLMHSRVGYAMVRSGRTYLIISTGRDDVRVRITGAQGQPAGTGAPSFVDVSMASDSEGQRLLIASVPLGTAAEYQFTLDGAAASIPTLHNPDLLPLVTLPEGAGFVAISPVTDQRIAGGMVAVSGYARVFEAQFTVRIVAANGRVLGQKQVKSAAGAPSWGSFRADVMIDTADLPETGFVIFEEPMTQSRLAVPIRFRATTQLG